MATIAGIDFRRPRTTIADVARRAGVSTSSVSRHLQGQRVNGSAAIDAAMRELDYRPSALARSLKSGRTDTIGLVVPDVTNPFFAGVVKGAESVAQDAGYQLVLCNTDESSDREHGVLSTIRDRVDGLLLAPARDDAETSESLADLGVPIVLVDRTLPDPGDADAVLIDNAGGAAAAARLLIEDGHQRIAFVSGPLDTTPGAERHAGFVAECEAAGVDVVVEVADFKEHGGYQAAMRLFAGAEPPTAAFAANNLMTIGVLRALRDLGLAVPRAVSVVGFDDHLLADLLDPPLSVIDRDIENQGAVAMRMLLARLSGDVTGPGRTVRLDTRLIRRSSTASQAAVMKRRHAAAPAGAGRDAVDPRHRLDDDRPDHLLRSRSRGGRDAGRRPLRAGVRRQGRQPGGDGGAPRRQRGVGRLRRRRRPRAGHGRQPRGQRDRRLGRDDDRRLATGVAPIWVDGERCQPHPHRPRRQRRRRRRHRGRRVSPAATTSPSCSPSWRRHRRPAARRSAWPASAEP